jgi:hypothetical protein
MSEIGLATRFKGMPKMILGTIRLMQVRRIDLAAVAENCWIE